MFRFARLPPFHVTGPSQRAYIFHAMGCNKEALAASVPVYVEGYICGACPKRQHGLLVLMDMVLAKVTDEDAADGVRAED